MEHSVCAGFESIHHEYAFYAIKKLDTEVEITCGTEAEMDVFGRWQKCNDRAYLDDMKYLFNLMQPFVLNQVDLKYRRIYLH